MGIQSGSPFQSLAENSPSYHRNSTSITMRGLLGSAPEIKKNLGHSQNLIGNLRSWPHPRAVRTSDCGQLPRPAFHLRDLFQDGKQFVHGVTESHAARSCRKMVASSQRYQLQFTFPLTLHQACAATLHHGKVACIISGWLMFF